jgi:hypothetical protein
MNKQIMRHAVRAGVMSLSIILFLSIAASSFFMGAQKQSQPLNVGMVALLAVPEKYNGKIIRTWGFLNLRYESDALFLHEEDLRVPLLKNSFRLELTEEQEKQFKNLNLTYVMVQGTLHSEGADTPDLNSGTILNITLVHGWKPFVPFESETTK